MFLKFEIFFWAKLKSVQEKSCHLFLWPVGPLKPVVQAFHSHHKDQTRGRQERVCSSVWSLQSVVANSRNTPKASPCCCICVWEKKSVHSSDLASTPRRTGFHLYFLKTRDSDSFQRRLKEKQFPNPSAQGLSSVSHEDLGLLISNWGLFFYWLQKAGSVSGWQRDIDIVWTLSWHVGTHVVGS